MYRYFSCYNTLEYLLPNNKHKKHYLFLYYVVLEYCWVSCKGRWTCFFLCLCLSMDTLIDTLFPKSILEKHICNVLFQNNCCGTRYPGSGKIVNVEVDVVMHCAISETVQYILKFDKNNLQFTHCH